MDCWYCLENTASPTPRVLLAQPLGAYLRSGDGQIASQQSINRCIGIDLDNISDKYNNQGHRSKGKVSRLKRKAS